MIAAMANFLGYDVYDIELTSIKNNTWLRRMFSKICNKSIIVLEDIDCSLDLIGERKKKMVMVVIARLHSLGFLNFIDGISFACGGEKIIAFTTSHIEKLDPDLIRRGRMDKQIELFYCKFEAFKVLVKSYLEIEPRPLFERISQLLEEVDMSPADAAKNLMRKTEDADEDGNAETQDKECRKEEMEIYVMILVSHMN